MPQLSRNYCLFVMKVFTDSSCKLILQLITETNYYMLECLIEQRQAICAAEIESKVNSELSSQQWQFAKKSSKNIKAL